ncbi:MAG: DNA-processing protein DprA [Ilumatobacteraceae bacterium]
MSAAALAAMPLMTRGRLSRLVALGDPAVTFRAVLAGERPLAGVEDHVWEAWESCAGLDGQTEERCIEAGVWVTWRGDSRYPGQLRDDPAAPAVVFCSGDAAALAVRRVGIVGTRRCTAAGAHIARRLGADLSLNGVAVVSGLARGIDVHAHRGALGVEGAAPVAVVASGPDTVYPPEHSPEWSQIAERGLLLSEWPPGTEPDRHRFPLRNRILAALSEVLVVVESRARGGSMITVTEAARRGATVMAVPGSPSLEVCEGTNNLLKDGCAPVTEVDDVLVALGLDNSRTLRHVDTRPAASPAEAAVLTALGGMPRTVDEIVITCALDAYRAGVLLGSLEAKGRARHTNGWWEALP